MNGNWDQLFKLIVPLSFLAIWAITSLFNRDSKPTTPLRSAGSQPPYGPRPTNDPPLRWSPPPSQGQGQSQAGVRRMPVNNDDILIISADGSRATRSPLAGGPRRSSKTKQVAPAARAVEPSSTSTRTKLAGVSQNVNQHLTHSVMEMAPLTGMPPTATSTTLGLSSAPTAAATATRAPVITLLSAALADPIRLREAMLISEILQPPVSLRPRNRGRR